MTSASTAATFPNIDASPHGVEMPRAPWEALPVLRDLTVPYVLSLLISAMLVVISVAGLVFGERVLYEPDPLTLPAFLGQDGVTLVAGVPLLLGSVWGARRGSVRGLLLWTGSLFYIAYSYAYYLTLFNPLFLAYVCVVSMSLFGLIYLLVSTDAVGVRARFADGAPARLAGGFLMLMMGLFGLMWAAAVVGALVGGSGPTDVQRIVWPLDLAVAFPAGFWGGVWLWRRRPLAYIVAPLLLVKLGFLGLTLALNAALSTLWQAPLDPFTPGYAAGGLGSALLAVRFLRSAT
jgi:hypothetical protein